MSNQQVVSFDPLRTLAYTSVTTSYVAVGGALAHPVRLICITNNTDGDMLFSVDGSTDVLIVPATSFKLFDLCTNKYLVDQQWLLRSGTQFYVKYASSPTKGAVYIECLWGE